MKRCSFSLTGLPRALILRLFVEGSDRTDGGKMRYSHEPENLLQYGRLRTFAQHRNDQDSMDHCMKT
jgi:hypothetical protein